MINNPFSARNAAGAFGNTVIYGAGDGAGMAGPHPNDYGAYGNPNVNWGRHEAAHTYQYQALGIFFMPAYFLSGGMSGPSGNNFEQAAQNYGSGQGSWWPW